MSKIAAAEKASHVKHLVDHFDCTNGKVFVTFRDGTAILFDAQFLFGMMRRMKHSHAKSYDQAFKGQPMILDSIA